MKSRGIELEGTMSLADGWNLRAAYAYVDADDLPRRGEARAAIVAGLLYIVTFDAPRTDYFDRLLGDVHRLTDSAVL